MQNNSRDPPLLSTRWNLAHVFLWTLFVMVVVFVVSNLRDSGADLSHWMKNGPLYEVLAYILGQILALPLIVTAGAFIRNRLVT